MKEERDIICLKNDEKKMAKLEFEVVEEGAWIRVSLDDLCVEKVTENYFDTLIEIRRVLEGEGIKLLCKGACKCVYPSAMIQSMGRARKAYQLTMGMQAKMESLVDIFDGCNSQEYATIEEQRQYFQEWTDSIHSKSKKCNNRRTETIFSKVVERFIRKSK